MPHELVFSAIALEEINQADIYYESQSSGLGQKFLEALKESFKKLKENPQYFGFINEHKIIRDLKVDAFPFLIVYQIIANKVYIIRVFNTNRDPHSLKNL
ncbi:type II toxin-antitoxin system RelE/ParE family toxin [soil metagenome]